MELLVQKEKLKLIMVTQAWKSSAWETEASQVVKSIFRYRVSWGPALATRDSFSIQLWSHSNINKHASESELVLRNKAQEAKEVNEELSLPSLLMPPVTLSFP